MRLLVALLFALSAHAGVPEKHVFIQISSPHSSEWTKIYKAKGTWLCQTESTPRYKAKRNPLEQLDWNKLKSEQARGPCKSTILVRDHQTPSRGDLTGCSESKTFGALLHQVNAACRTGSLSGVILDEKQ